VLERLERCDAVEGHATRTGEWQVGRGQHVAATQLDRIDPDATGRDVEHHLARDRLELPRPAVGGAADRVGEEELGRERRVRQPVRAGQQHGRQGPGADRPRHRVRAGVLHVVDVRGEHRAVGVEGHPDVTVLEA
jgi:hypothetical protein